MKYDVKIPAVGESISEATIGSWVKKNGEAVKRNDILMTIETDKATVEVVAEQDGVLTISAEAGKTLPINAVVGFIDSDAKPTTTSTVAAPAPSAPAPAMQVAPAGGASLHPDLKSHLSPAVQKIATEKGLNTSAIEGTGRGGRLTKEDVMKAQPQPAPAASPAPASPGKTAPSPNVDMTLRGLSKQGDQKRVPMSNIRKRIAERLVMSQQTTATLTTFNEIDMTKAMEIRAKYKDKFKEKYGLSLGFMGLFVKASIEALREWPAVNAFIEGNEVVYNNYYNIGVAVSTEKGLIVPAIKDADQMTIPQIEMAIRQYALKARDGKIGIDDLSGGTFTISNGGVFGSLMSTPILNPPQSGILGMHKIEDRPVAINGKVEIRPMMYVALSYDHRMIDGREAVSFLVKVKECIEEPERMLFEI
ncbi:MAG: dihydrolipoyllysine-residue succinyltransferase component of 2-oxoglutarate dehydrogenase complex [Oligoflexia bacterium]|nr:MAG: dihydrolipoyllysine-residue succinyltransferase component of 2-oxoglutarate dehydrogenase complex [Oligoflexia bacterium]